MKNSDKIENMLDKVKNDERDDLSSDDEKLDDNQVVSDSDERPKVLTTSSKFMENDFDASKVSK